MVQPEDRGAGTQLTVMETNQYLMGLRPQPKELWKLCVLEFYMHTSGHRSALLYRQMIAWHISKLTFIRIARHSATTLREENLAIMSSACSQTSP